MARTFQLMGLPDEAYAFIANLKKVGDGEFNDYFYGDGYACQIYEDEEGNRFVEYEQDCPWSSGPMLFLGLKNEKTGEIVFEWKQEDIDDYSC